jgi:glycosyltransferase involved in cell wall biosynthesis
LQRGSRMPKLSVVIPVYNEVQTLEEVVARVREVPVDKEIILVDDGSTDGTREVLSRLEGQSGLKVIYHEKNQGKGAALRTGFEHCEGEIVIIQDADLEYFPEEYPSLLEPIEKGWADVVYGSRFLGHPHRVLFFHHYLANQLLTFLSNLFTNLNLTDMESCYKVFRRDVLQKLDLKSNRFGFEPEVTAKMARLKCRVFEVAVSYNGRTYDEGKKINWKDGLVAIWHIIRYSLFD